MILSIQIQKGGVGKTTSSVCLAGALAAEQQRVLVVDLDPQANATSWLGAKGDEGAQLLEIFTGERRQLVPVKTGTEGIDVICGGEHMALVLATTATNPAATLRLRKPLQKLTSDYDLIILDCPPTISPTTFAALHACDAVLIPTTTEKLSIDGIVRAHRMITQASDDYDRELPLAGVLVTLHDGRRNHDREALRHLQQQLGELLFTRKVRANVSVCDASSACMPVEQYAPSSNAAVDYRAVAQELLQRLHTLSSQETSHV